MELVGAMGLGCDLSRLDRLGVGYIEFNEFSKLTKDYGVDWSELQIAKSKNNVS